MSPLRSIWLIAANTAILWLLFEGGADVAIRTLRVIRPAFGYSELSDVARLNYAHMPAADVEELWRATMALRYRYLPVAAFTEAPLASPFINIDEHGIRSNGVGEQRIDGAVWFFGGSTTFGFGVADRETIPARLQSALGKPVLNFGVRAYNSALETRLLAHYLRLGFVPSKVLFLDGINEACEPDLPEDEIGEMVRRAQDGYQWELAHPIRYAARRLTARVIRAAGRDDDEFRLITNCRASGRKNSLKTIERRLIDERASLCRLYQITCHLFIQPFAGVHGRDTEPGFRTTREARYFQSLYEYLESTWRDAGATFVTNALDDAGRHPFVDSAHYSADANARIARALALYLADVTTTASSAPSR
jgi:hypothetical protein